jgi:DNA-binding Lrp family transcriptional regulator
VGLPVVAFVSLSVTPGKIPEVAVELAKMDCVVEVHQIHNSGDLLVKIRAEDLGDLGETLANRVRRVADVDMVDAVSVLKVWKDAPA